MSRATAPVAGAIRIAWLGRIKGGSLGISAVRPEERPPDPTSLASVRDLFCTRESIHAFKTGEASWKLSNFGGQLLLLTCFRLPLVQFSRGLLAPLALLVRGEGPHLIALQM